MQLVWLFDSRFSDRKIVIGRVTERMDLHQI